MTQTIITAILVLLAFGVAAVMLYRRLRGKQGSAPGCDDPGASGCPPGGCAGCPKATLKK